MTPKEKAIDLIAKFRAIEDNTGILQISNDEAKKCALVCVDEFLYSMDTLAFLIKIQNDNVLIGYVDFWANVKQEIEKI